MHSQGMERKKNKLDKDTAIIKGAAVTTTTSLSSSIYKNKIANNKNDTQNNNKLFIYKCFTLTCLLNREIETEFNVIINYTIKNSS